MKNLFQKIRFTGTIENLVIDRPSSSERIWGIISYRPSFYRRAL